MPFKDSKYFKKLSYKIIQLDFGTFYLLDKCIIAEINEGVHYSWEEEHELYLKLIEHYSSDAKIGYISNRINAYSIDTEIWSKFVNEYDFIIASAIVTYNDFSYINATIEKEFSKKSLKRCTSLDQAINWVLNLIEFKENPKEY
ncbi:hypothetical protein [Pontimicrobium aquaticum]|uniref:STAS/SEC14 domain-containing protein n=1 Tax=Pontimicrobium aquaticum TaxID=2565367 RepID=A0A4V5LQ52_9FLAO|nr:hypothetical protein [Pontimicrobium aquaticum]TJY34029.1 hypothetical protein E5167_11975 [Pontimicrobium aquaticum]